MSDDPIPDPPDGLSPASKAWWRQVVGLYVFSASDLRLLKVCCEAWDQYEGARLIIAQQGSTFLDRFGQPKTRPEIAVMRDARLAFVRIFRELGLRDADQPKPTKEI